MRRLFVVAVLALAGCQGVVGPFARPPRPDRVDDPRLSISEQERKGRDRLAYPDETPTPDAPRSALDPPQTYRYGR
jgi:hypothetical protein